MKFGKRRWEARHDAKSAAAAATPASEPRPESWSVAGNAPPAPPPAVEDGGDAVVEGDAVELPAEAPAAEAYMPPTAAQAAASSPPTTAYVAPVPPFPVAEEPVAVVSPESETGGVAPLGEAGPFYASGHAHGTAPSWPEPVLQLAAERPEIVVGAAFAGGILLAAILRRLGH
jgi:hypothetical protein